LAFLRRFRRLLLRACRVLNALLLLLRLPLLDVRALLPLGLCVLGALLLLLVLHLHLVLGLLLPRLRLLLDVRTLPLLIWRVRSSAYASGGPQILIPAILHRRRIRIIDVSAAYPMPAS
jgi:hypothetical protein